MVKAIIPNQRDKEVFPDVQDGIQQYIEPPRTTHEVGATREFKMVDDALGTVEINLDSPTSSKEHLNYRIKFGGSTILTIKNGEINLGGEEATEPLVLGESFKGFLNGFIAKFNTHKHFNGTAVDGSTGNPVAASIASSMGDDLLSDVAFTRKDFDESGVA